MKKRCTVRQSEIGQRFAISRNWHQNSENQANYKAALGTTSHLGSPRFTPGINAQHLRTINSLIPHPQTLHPQPKFPTTSRKQRQMRDKQAPKNLWGRFRLQVRRQLQILSTSWLNSESYSFPSMTQNFKDILLFPKSKKTLPPPSPECITV